MSAVTEDAKPEDAKPEPEKKIYYCEVSALLGGFSECVLKRRLQAWKIMLWGSWAGLIQLQRGRVVKEAVNAGE